MDDLDPTGTNKALARRFFEAQGKGDLDALEKLLAPDFVDHGLLPGQDPLRYGGTEGQGEEVTHRGVSLGG
jgi:ketosteroid isomerase-like protein